jgi:preprotein translocase subunit SecD
VKTIGKKLVFVMDNKLIYAATVQSQITFGLTAISSNGLSKEDLEKIQAVIETEKK